MRMSCLPVSFFSDIVEGRMSVPQWARMGAELGLDAVDLSILFVPDRSANSVRQLRHDVEAAGTSIAMVTSYPDFTHPNPTTRRREIERAREVVEVAAGLGARMLRVTAGQAHPETVRSDGTSWAIDGLTRLAEATRGSTVTLVYENHAKPGAWTYTDFSQPPEIFLEIARGIADTGIGINFDLGNAAAFADDPLALLDAVIDRVVSVHASDTSSRGQMSHVLLGTGVTPYAAFFEKLVSAGWDGWICLEEASYQGREGVKAAISFVRKTWNEAVVTATRT
ncbi:MAG TPA: sugar phosphate isomerase/epimerase family protein [Chloroflexota bacterium]